MADRGDSCLFAWPASGRSRGRHGRQLLQCGLLVCALLLLSACSAPLVAPAPTPGATVSPPAVAFLPAEQALPGLVAAEREASIAGDPATLATLWSADSRIVDGRTTAASDDDYVWDGRDAILDRYVVAVFPNPPPPASFEALEITVAGQEATGVNGGDRWRFTFADSRWWLTTLTYQQPD